MVSVYSGFTATTILGVLWACYGLTTSLTNFGIGVAFAGVGIIGREFARYQP